MAIPKVIEKHPQRVLRLPTRQSASRLGISPRRDFLREPVPADREIQPMRIGQVCVGQDDDSRQGNYQQPPSDHSFS